jgi:energy-converting hydrogenase Eha subunit B
MRRWGAIGMSALMMVWAGFNLCARPGHKTAWYIAGLVVGLVIFLVELTIKAEDR